MRFKQYLEYVSKRIPADSDKPTDIVQMLACLIAQRLSTGGRLPVSCGSGNNLDMDIVQAGILAGLEKIADYDSKLGTMRQFLYPTIAGVMANYAWERENRVGDCRPKAGLPPYQSVYDDGTLANSVDGSNEGSTGRELLPTALIENSTPESLMEAEEASKDALAGVRAAVGGLGSEGMGMLLRDAQIGYNAAKRQEWASEIGVSVGALSMRLARLRRDARDWALTVQ
jgi:hypothetical protein